MTEQEQKAIKWMKNVRDDAVVTLDHIAKEEPNVSPMLYAGRKEKAETIINGFEELKKYREIGTVEECKNSVLKILEAYNKAIDDFVKEICKMIVQSENNDNYRFYAVEIKQAIADIAEQLKDGGGE